MGNLALEPEETGKVWIDIVYAIGGVQHVDLY